MKLYRIILEHCYNGGSGRHEVASREVLYCGYDRLEAARVYHGTLGTGHDVPGRYFTRVVAQSKAIAESV